MLVANAWKCDNTHVLTSTCKQHNDKKNWIADAFLFIQWLRAHQNRSETRKRMNHEDSADDWGSQRPETPAPFDASEYSQLISAGPLLPLLEQYAGVGTMRAKKWRETFAIFATMDMTFYLCRALSFVLQVLMTRTLLGGPRGKCSHKALTLTNVRAANSN